VSSLKLKRNRCHQSEDKHAVRRKQIGVGIAFDQIGRVPHRKKIPRITHANQQHERVNQVEKENHTDKDPVRSHYLEVAQLGDRNHLAEARSEETSAEALAEKKVLRHSQDRGVVTEVCDLGRVRNVLGVKHA